MNSFLIVSSLLCIFSVNVQSQRCSRHAFLPEPSFTIGKVCKETKSCTNQCQSFQKEVCNYVNEYVCTTYKRYQCVTQNSCPQRNQSNISKHNGVLTKIMNGKKKFLRNVVNGIMNKVRKARCVHSKHCSAKSSASLPQGPSSEGVQYQWKSNPALNIRKKNRSSPGSYNQKSVSIKPMPPLSSNRDTSLSSNSIPEYTKKNHGEAQKTRTSSSSSCNEQVCTYVPYKESCGLKPRHKCQYLPQKECKFVCSSSWTCCGQETVFTTTPRPPFSLPQSSIPPIGPPAPPISPGPPAPPTDFNIIVGPPSPDVGIPLEDDYDDNYDYDEDFLIVEA
ncbi:uncharacterized protein [Lepeophtheirus salmonis]|uniref:uncharacterized protein n=1 Tax=Lepeophtheirus salmonis TaxID=72036 RepID=UPI001AE7A860|nr:uncharacterized protein LOC121115832 isoform X1 [Lepeophtheirus salmonis]